MSSTVLVTGASGFVALHCVGLLLSKGYTVIGTVRSQQQADKITKQFTEKLGEKPALSFAIVKDIAVDGAFDQVFKDNSQIKYVLHTASPFLYGLTELESGYLTPAVHGTVGVLESIEKYGPQVEKVVITSSFASILDMSKVADESFVHTEATWNPIEWSHVTESVGAYVASKKLAERAAWDFLKEHKVNFTLNTVCPPMVLGPQFFDEDAAADKLNTSAQDIKNLLDIPVDSASLPEGPIFPGVDVRDVAAFHVLPLEKSIGGERLFPIACPATSSALGLNVISKTVPELNGKIYKPSKEEVEKDAAQGWRYDNSKSCELLGGYKFIPYETQITDAIKQILKAQAAKAAKA